MHFCGHQIAHAGMCYRVGFGTDIETAEAQRSRRKGLRRVSTWKSHRSVVNTELEDETA